MSRVLAALVVLAETVAATAGARQPEPAHRVAVRYQQGSIFVVSITDVAAALPESDALPATGMPLAGFWFELQDAGGAVRYRRIVGDAVRLWQEPVAGPGVSPGTRRSRASRAGETEPATLLHVAPRTDGAVSDGAAPTSGDDAVVLRREDIMPQSRLFALLMPRARAGDQLVLYSSPLLNGYHDDQPATVVARLALDVE